MAGCIYTKSSRILRDRIRYLYMMIYRREKRLCNVSKRDREIYLKQIKEYKQERKEKIKTLYEIYGIKYNKKTKVK